MERAGGRGGGSGAAFGWFVANLGINNYRRKRPITGVVTLLTLNMTTILVIPMVELLPSFWYFKQKRRLAKATGFTDDEEGNDRYAF